jgi:hypothetical protein
LANGLAQGATNTDSSESVSPGYGGCIAIDGGTVLLSNCVLSANVALGGSSVRSVPSPDMPGGPAYGGAIYSQFGSLTLVQTKIDGGVAQGGNGYTSFTTVAPGGIGGPAFGGAIFASGGSVTILSSTISSNNATGGPTTNAYWAQPPGTAFGGALYASNSLVVISNSAFILNTTFSSPTRFDAMSLSGGGALYLQSSVSGVSGTLFSNNIVHGGSGTNGISSGGGAIFADGQTTLSGCRFVGNSVLGTGARLAVSAPGCGGAFFNAGNASILESQFSSNKAERR